MRRKPSCAIPTVIVLIAIGYLIWYQFTRDPTTDLEPNIQTPVRQDPEVRDIIYYGVANDPESVQQYLNDCSDRGGNLNECVQDGGFLNVCRFACEL